MKKESATCSVKIVDDFPVAKIYIDGTEIKGVRKYKIKRAVGTIPIVRLELIPLELDMDLSETTVRGLSGIRFKIFKLFFRLKEKLSHKDESI